MLVLSMESKRQRRPNIRSGEIGDVSSDFECGVSQKIKKRIWGNRWEYGFINPQESEYNHISGFSQQRLSEFTVSHPSVSPRFLANMQHNRENKNPNSTKSFSGFTTLDEIDLIKSKVNLGAIAQKFNLVKKGRRSKRRKRTVFEGLWNFGVIHESSTESLEKYEGEEVIGFASNPRLNLYDFNDTRSPDSEDSALSKENLGNNAFEPTFKLQIGGNSNEIWKEGDSLEGNNLLLESFGRCNNTESFCSEVNSVDRWLEELGFGRYASVFEMHEVDEEALPLLTLEDLKEMGVAVGPRRKLYTAIRQVRDIKG